MLTTRARALIPSLATTCLASGPLRALRRKATGLVVRLRPTFTALRSTAKASSIRNSPEFQDASLLEAAWNLPVARAYGRGDYPVQLNPSLCGAASIAAVLRSQNREIAQTDVVAGVSHRLWFGILFGGLTLDQVADLMHRHIRGPVSVLRDMPLDAFRRELWRFNDPAWRFIANFHRGPLFGHGHGHFSPLLAYLSERDLVLVGDVNRHYRPFLVRSDRLWLAMNTVDRATGRRRGLIAAGPLSS